MREYTRPCIVKGVFYPSLYSACKAVAPKEYSRIKARVRRGIPIDRAFQGPSKPYYNRSPKIISPSKHSGPYCKLPDYFVKEKLCRKCNQVKPCFYYKSSDTKHGPRHYYRDDKGLWWNFHWCGDCQWAGKGHKTRIKLRTPEERLKLKKAMLKKAKHTPQGRIRKALARRISKIVKNDNKYNDLSPSHLLGCSVREFVKHVESKFYPNPETREPMTWKNYGYHGWHLDHIQPLGSFDLGKNSEILKANHYTNFQPLWEKDHDKKTTSDMALLQLKKG